VFEADHSAGSSSPPSAIWARWIDPARWPDWDPRVQDATADGDLAEGTGLRVKLRKGGTTRHQVTELEPNRRLVTEYRLPGARVGHDRTVEQRGQGSLVTHRLYVDGPLSGLWAMMLGRRKMRETVAGFADAGSPI
jgi:uncharacterized protein YndB with AHSA1/START domain